MPIRRTARENRIGVASKGTAETACSRGRWRRRGQRARPGADFGALVSIPRKPMTHIALRDRIRDLCDVLQQLGQATPQGLCLVP